MDEQNQPLPWFELPFYRSLSEQILLLGVPKAMIVLNGFVMFLFIINFNFWMIIPVNLIVHFGCIYLAKNDDQFFDCLRKYVQLKDYYGT